MQYTAEIIVFLYPVRVSVGSSQLHDIIPERRVQLVYPVARQCPITDILTRARGTDSNISVNGIADGFADGL